MWLIPIASATSSDATDATWPQPLADSVAVGAFRSIPLSRYGRLSATCHVASVRVACDTLQTGGLAEPHTKSIAYEW
jgi:hypothetical protein